MTVFALLELFSDLAFIAMTAYLTGRSRFIMRCIRRPFNPLSQFVLVVLFAFLAITDAFNTIPWGAAPLITVQLTGVLLAGITGGTAAGCSVGLIISLFIILADNSAAMLQAIFTIVAGILSGTIRFRLDIHQISPAIGASLAAIAEISQVLFIMLVSPATEVKLTATALSILMSASSVALFLWIINWIEAEQDIYGARAAQLSLDIASRTLPYLRLGFNTHSATVTAQIIFELTKVDAVSITGRYKILAFVGQGADHHKPGDPIISIAAKQTVASKVMKVINCPEDRDCPVPHCPLRSGVVVPLFSGNKVIGTIELARVNNEALSELDIRIADGLANLLSVQIQLAEIDQQRKMREKAELKALRAQINPHFLFNTISIIMSFCRTDPDKARTLLGSLATLMQQGYSHKGDFIPLEDELAAVDAYLEIAKSRFGDRLEVAVNVENSVMDCLIPVLSLQPLVENALHHGLFHKLGNCLLCIDAYREGDTAIISVTDNGVGIPPDKLALIEASKSDGVGINNVRNRLSSFYGSKYGLTITSQPSVGTEARICLPIDQILPEKSGEVSNANEHQN
ncbi:histidine kinase [Sporomusa sp.]|uniref:histidine kinase n=1 Tax=Sporomusa sp. TaxID=2078658 RepID=UPI002C70BCD8|nr:histidine kinase [Sporomusa sp.]HWR44099.1 histidine kinase [Sporomusa sp.]